jgi:trimeric autotransporter adhesin
MLEKTCVPLYLLRSRSAWLVATVAVTAGAAMVAARSGTFYGQAMTGGDIYTVAGDGTQGFSGDGGPATSAELNQPDAVAVNGAGSLFIADLISNRIREVAG